jgi:succinyl-diaminopimelate desuccinylase
MSISKTLELAIELLTEPSVTPNDAGCQKIIANRLQPLGFNIETMNKGEVSNLYARRGKSEPYLMFAGHTDVVPPGPVEHWSWPPFLPKIKDGYLYARGAADMKSSLAAMVCACEDFIRDYPEHAGSIGFLITSDEEGTAIDGTRYVVDQLIARQEKINYCVVGEASSENQFGDTIKVGRRGSLNGVLLVHGKQGHVAYPHKADNPIHKSLAALDELAKTKWDDGNKHFPPTTLQMSNIHAGTNANNVIPNHLEASFNFRFSNAMTSDQLRKQVHDILDKHHFKYDLEWQLSGEPFLSDLGDLFHATTAAIKKVTGVKTNASTTGGTSDGRFIIKTGCELLEIGPINDSIHKIDEHISVEELELLKQVYQQVLMGLLKTT